MQTRTDFTVENGLPDSVVNAVVQTANGLLWVGTQSGLASFDWFGLWDRLQLEWGWRC